MRKYYLKPEICSIVTFNTEVIMDSEAEFADIWGTNLQEGNSI